MENIHEISLLLDYYGKLLTQKQYDVIDMHYNDDYSFGEIAQNLNISRQAVYDNIKRGKKILFDMEEKLKLVKRVKNQICKVEEIIDIIENISIDDEYSSIKEKLKKIKEKVLYFSR